mgnify:CR=1 FL=1
MSKTAYIAKYANDAQYHGDTSRLSGSALELFIKNPSAYEAWRRGVYVPRSTPALAFGSYFHALLFEPDTVKDRFAIEPEDEDPKRAGKCIRRSTNVYKAWKAKEVRSGKTVVDFEDAVKVGPMVDAIVATPSIHHLLTREDGRNEVPLHWLIEGDGRPMRAKLDRVIPETRTIVELKTDRDPDLDSNSQRWALYDRGLHRKAFIYLDACRQVWGGNWTMVHIFVRTEGRPIVVPTFTEVDSPAVQLGEIEVKRAIARLEECEISNDFRTPYELGAVGYAPRPLPIPGPKLSELEFEGGGAVELDVDGEEVSL